MAEKKIQTSARRSWLAETMAKSALANLRVTVAKVGIDYGLQIGTLTPELFRQTPSSQFRNTSII